MSPGARGRRSNALLVCLLAAGVFGCAGATYSTGYYGSSWGYGSGWGYPYPCCYGGGSVIVRPPHHRPPGGRPPHVRPPRPPAQLPSRPRPQPRRRGMLEDAVRVAGAARTGPPDLPRPSAR